MKLPPATYAPFEYLIIFKWKCIRAIVETGAVVLLSYAGEVDQDDL